MNPQNANHNYSGDATCSIESQTMQIDRAIVTITERSAELRGRIIRMKERAVGSEPEKSQGQSPRPVPSGIVGAMRQHAEDLSQVIEECHSLISNLETVI